MLSARKKGELKRLSTMRFKHMTMKDIQERSFPASDKVLKAISSFLENESSMGEFINSLALDVIIEDVYGKYGWAYLNKGDRRF